MTNCILWVSFIAASLCRGWCHMYGVRSKGLGACWATGRLSSWTRPVCSLGCLWGRAHVMGPAKHEHQLRNTSVCSQSCSRARRQLSMAYDWTEHLLHDHLSSKGTSAQTKEATFWRRLLSTWLLPWMVQIMLCWLTCSCSGLSLRHCSACPSQRHRCHVPLPVVQATVPVAQLCIAGCLENSLGPAAQLLT